MAALKVLGDWLEDSGWIEALVQANVASAGTAESFLKASHVKRSRLAHEVTASSLHILLKKAYACHVESLQQDDQSISFEEWYKECSQQSPHFKFWHTIYNLENKETSLFREETCRLVFDFSWWRSAE